MRKLLLTFVVFLLVAEGFSQDDPQFTQNMFNRMSINPAVTASSDMICGTLISKQQWIGFDGRPKTYLFSGEMPLSGMSLFQKLPWSSGGGITIYQDQLGPASTVLGKLAYSAGFDLGSTKIYAGIDLGYVNKSVSDTWQAGDGDVSTTQDPYVKNIAAGTFDAGLGVYMKTELSNGDKAYAGISTLHLPALSLQGVDLLNRTYYLMAGYDKVLTEDITLKPSVFAKTTNGANVQFDLNTNVLYKGKYWGGLSYRLQESVDILLGMEIITGLQAGLAYDLITNSLKSYNKGSVELFVKYCFEKEEKIDMYNYRDVKYL